MLEGHFKFPTTTGPSHSNSPKFVHTSCNTTWDSLQVPRLGGFARRQKREGCHVRGVPSPCDPKCLSPVGPHSRNFMNINLIVTRYDAGPQTRLICRLRCLRGGSTCLHRYSQTNSLSILDLGVLRRRVGNHPKRPTRDIK